MSSPTRPFASQRRGIAPSVIDGLAAWIGSIHSFVGSVNRGAATYFHALMKCLDIDNDFTLLSESLIPDRFGLGDQMFGSAMESECHLVPVFYFSLIMIITVRRSKPLLMTRRMTDYQLALAKAKAPADPSGGTSSYQPSRRARGRSIKAQSSPV